MNNSKAVTGQSIRPRRSVLYMPATNQRAMQKAQTLPADVIIFDLEDAVAVDQKAEGRRMLQEQLAQSDYGNRQVMVRINGADTPWFGDDLALVRDLAIDGVVLPKVETTEVIRDVLYVLSIDEAVIDSNFRIWPMIETPTGVFNVRDILSVDSRVDCLIMGTSDLAKAMRLPASVGREGMISALSQCVMAACEKQIDVLDGVCLDVHSSDAMQQQAEQGRLLGFTGKTLIHPKQIDIANSVFGVSNADYEAAQGIVSAWHEAEKKGEGVAVVDGKLIESLHYDDARRIIALAEAIAAG
jgi:citrate lyase subunit beta/citryl-CoA lyase